MEPQLMEAKQSQIEQAGHQWLRWLRPLYRGRLRLDKAPRLRRTPVLFAFALIAAGSIVTFLPVRIDSAALGDLADADSTGVVPALCFLIGDLCLAAGMWAAIAAARGRYLERPAVAALGVIAAAVAGQCLRLMLQIILLRRFYRPELLFTSPGRAAAVGWGLLLTMTLTAGFLGPLLVAAANLVPRVLADKARPLRWLAGRHWWLLLPFVALAVTAIISQWVLPPSLAAAMGYTYPAPSGETVTVSLRDLGPAAWSSLQILFALPLLVLMWEGVEAARTCHRLVEEPKGGQTAMLARALRIDYRVAAGAVVITAGWFAVTHGTALPALAGAGLLVIISLSVKGDLGRVARLARGFERGVSRWQMPEEWRDVGRISLLLTVLAFPVIVVVCGNIALGAKAGLWFLSDLHGFYFYWHDYGFISIPVLTASGIYGHVDSLVWVICFALAALIFTGMLIQMFDKGVRGGYRAIWFLLRVGALAFLLAPVARLADHSYATFILTGCAVVAVLAAFGRRIQPAAVWSAVIVGGALTLWSLVLWHTTWLPAAALVCLTVLQRFVYNAGTLNEPRQYRPNRVAYFQAIALISIAMLVLGHGATSGHFQSDALSVVSDRVALSVVAAIWLVMLVVKQTHTTTDDPAGTVTKEPLPRSWAWMLDPHRAMVSFTGRKDELAALLAWCQNSDAERLRLVTGFGGTGKTRLAVELATRLAQLGWAAIWASPGQEGTAIGAAHALPSGRVLVVVDNAEIRTGGGLKQMLTDADRQRQRRRAGAVAGQISRGMVRPACHRVSRRAESDRAGQAGRTTALSSRDHRQARSRHLGAGVQVDRETLRASRDE